MRTGDAMAPKPEQNLEAEEPSDKEGEVSEFIHALTLFLLAHLQLADCADRELEPLNMHRTHHRILYFCAQCPGRTVGDLARALRLTLQAVQTPLRMLIKSGWIEQRRSASDKRQRLLFLTPLGKAMHTKLARKQFQLLSQARRTVGEQAFDGFLETTRALSRQSDLLLFDEIATTDGAKEQPERPKL